MVRTRKVAVLLQDDAAVRFEMLTTILGLSSQFRKSGDADAALLETMVASYQRLVEAVCAKTGKSWCDRADVEKLLGDILAAPTAAGAGQSTGDIAATLSLGKSRSVAVEAPAEEVVQRTAAVTIGQDYSDVVAAISLKQR